MIIVLCGCLSLLRDKWALTVYVRVHLREIQLSRIHRHLTTSLTLVATNISNVKNILQVEIVSSKQDYLVLSLELIM